MCERIEIKFTLMTQLHEQRRHTFIQSRDSLIRIYYKNLAINQSCRYFCRIKLRYPVWLRLIAIHEFMNLQIWWIIEYLWYWACKKLNSSLIRSQESPTENLNGCPGCGGPCNTKTPLNVSMRRNPLTPLKPIIPRDLFERLCCSVLSLLTWNRYRTGQKNVVTYISQKKAAHQAN